MEMNVVLVWYLTDGTRGCPMMTFTVDTEKGKSMKYFKATDSNGTELYLFQLEDNSFISIPKEHLKFKSLSPEEVKEKIGEINDS